MRLTERDLRTLIQEAMFFPDEPARLSVKHIISSNDALKSSFAELTDAVYGSNPDAQRALPALASVLKIALSVVWPLVNVERLNTRSARWELETGINEAVGEIARRLDSFGGPASPSLPYEKNLNIFTSMISGPVLGPKVRDALIKYIEDALVHTVNFYGEDVFLGDALETIVDMCEDLTQEVAANSEGTVMARPIRTDSNTTTGERSYTQKEEDFWRELNGGISGRLQQELMRNERRIAAAGDEERESITQSISNALIRSINFSDRDFIQKMKKLWTMSKYYEETGAPLWGKNDQDAEAGLRDMIQDIARHCVGSPESLQELLKRSIVNDLIVVVRRGVARITIDPQKVSEIHEVEREEIDREEERLKDRQRIIADRQKDLHKLRGLDRENAHTMRDISSIATAIDAGDENEVLESLANIGGKGFGAGTPGAQAGYALTPIYTLFGFLMHPEDLSSRTRYAKGEAHDKAATLQTFDSALRESLGLDPTKSWTVIYGILEDFFTTLGRLAEDFVNGKSSSEEFISDLTDAAARTSGGLSFLDVAEGMSNHFERYRHAERL